jgi:hypothetical protein
MVNIVFSSSCCACWCDLPLDSRFRGNYDEGQGGWHGWLQRKIVIGGNEPPIVAQSHFMTPRLFTQPKAADPPQSGILAGLRYEIPAGGGDFA